MKTNDECATRRIGNLPKASKVEQAKEVKGAHKKCMTAQVGDGGNMPVDQSERDEKRIPDVNRGVK